VNDKKIVYIIGGPNGAGKTTFVGNFLPNYVKVRNFINADNIAQGLSPLNPQDLMDIKAGKIMLQLLDEYKDKGLPFGFETTMAGNRWGKFFDELKEKGYSIFIFFLDLASVDLSIARVKYRVKSGGHNIPEETIRRRYARSRKNFWETYKDRSDSWYLFDNSGSSPILIANNSDYGITIADNSRYNSFVGSLGGDR
jgi:predicted ABC-type ATPase